MAMRSNEPLESLNECIKSYELDPTKVNIKSAITKAFVECFLKSKSRDYVSEFTRLIAVELDKMYSCRNLRNIFQSISRRIDEIILDLTRKERSDERIKRDLIIYDLQLTTSSRLLVGSRGGSFPFEVTMAWDSILNVPFIPSSSIKGVARAYFEIHVGSIGKYTAEEIFGSEKQEGLIRFTDAYPVSCKNKLLEPDVITPHYSEATGNIDEASSKPVPVVFLVVPPGVTFRSVIVAQDIEDEKIGIIVKRIVEALTRGIGAKTMVGYGLFMGQFMRKS